MKRRFFFNQTAITSMGLIAGSPMINSLFYGCKSDSQKLKDDKIQAYCIDFNWGPGGRYGFAKPGLWADANPEEHVKWYKDLGCNTIQTFAVSCNGYAWYKNGIIPEQPGLEYDFLTEMVKLGHKKDMKVFGYFCAGANNKWEDDHPELSYQMSGQQIPYTNQYIDYLCDSIEDAIRKTDMDGYMIDWFYNPGGGLDPLTLLRWLPCEQEMYQELMNQPFSGITAISPEMEVDYRQKAIDRAWNRIRETTRKAKPDCIIWLSANEPNSKEYAGSDMLKEIDWLMNEAGDIAGTEAVHNVIGNNTKLLTCLANWNQQDPIEVVNHANKENIGLYGFTRPVLGSLLPPINYYLAKPVDSYEGDERNIAVFARIYNDLPLDYTQV
jgi:hypothetical protein